MNSSTCGADVHTVPALKACIVEHSDASPTAHACINNQETTNSQSSDLAAYDNSTSSPNNTIIDTANTRKRALPVMEEHVPHHALKHYWCKKQCPIVLGPSRLLHIPRNLVEEDLDLDAVLQHGIDVQLEVDDQLLPGCMQATLAMYRNSTGHKYYRILGFKAISKQYESYLLVCWVAVSSNTVRMCIRNPNSKLFPDKQTLGTCGPFGIGGSYNTCQRVRPDGYAASGAACCHNEMAIPNTNGNQTPVVKLPVRDFTGRIIGFASDFVPIEQLTNTPTSMLDQQYQLTSAQAADTFPFSHVEPNNPFQAGNGYQPEVHVYRQNVMPAQPPACLPAPILSQNTTQGAPLHDINYSTIYQSVVAHPVWFLQQISQQQPHGMVSDLSNTQQPHMEMPIAPLYGV